MNSIRASFRQKFLAGLIVTIPIVITIFVLKWAILLVDGVLSPLFDYIIGYHLYGLGFVSSIVLIFFTGVVSTTVFGRKIIEYFENILKKIPVFKGLYSGLSQIAKAFSADTKGAFKKFVIIEYPRKGLFAFGFLTKECVIKNNLDNTECCVRAVYIPTNNLYLGEIVLCREEEVIYTDMTIEEGIRIVMSGGIATPDMLQGVKS
ncbi:MAG: hypothetical protein BV458_13795 [Thermoplasmata archaeon M9B2D]|nr:MAG: hypothetical protein BV458_13795 [Thermoplasmata archaeon M9B2D]